MKRVFNRTKVIATAGPACNDYKTLEAMIKAGVDIFRLNFSHAEYAEVEEAINNIKKINKKHDLSVGIMADLQGPKIRIGELEEELDLVEDQILTFTTKKCIGNEKRIYISYPHFPKDVQKGDIIMLDDGKVEMEVVSTNKKDEVKARIVNGGKLSSRKGVNLPNTLISLPSLTKKDLRDLDFALKQKAGWIALSFVRSAEDIHNLRKIIGTKDETLIIAKIEKPEAIKNLSEIIQATDAVMIARGDLGVELALDQLPIIQKAIVDKCIQASKPVIIATQIMDSMIKRSRPTRAEISDIANSVYEGADALMLSGETAVGKHPVKVIKTMETVLQSVEEEERIYNKGLTANEGSETFLSDAMCFSACKIAEEVNAKAIICMTRSGYTAFLVSSYRPKARIYVFTDNKYLVNSMNMTWGTKAIYYDSFVSTDDTINDVKNILVKKGYVKRGDVVVNLASIPIGEQSRTNMVKVSAVD